MYRGRRRLPVRYPWGMWHWFIPLFSLVLAAAAAAEDHSRFKALGKAFADGPAVTRACLECHEEAAEEVQATIHWRWDFVQPETGQRLGKRHVINSFCGATPSNEALCTACHAGYGWTDVRRPITAGPERVDCLVCHDTTGLYAKARGGAGAVAAGARDKLGHIARNVGSTSLETCGRCHFRGGSGDGVKHGDLDSSLLSAPRRLDVHMSPEGAGFTCADCHEPKGHDLPGSRYRSESGTGDGGHAGPAACTSCHGTAPHGSRQLDRHGATVACQTCHIPRFARGGVATKVWSDWSTAGRRGPDGEPLVLRDAGGHLTYHGARGDVRYVEDAVPSYRWFNGTVRYTLPGEAIEPDGPVPINRIEGGAEDGAARIWPFKVVRGRQPYDKVHRTLLVNKLYGGPDAFWSSFDWQRSLAAGAAYAGQAFSGEVGFAETVMYWPLNHMVAPKEEALGCGACHSKGGRLSDLTGFHLPGRDDGQVFGPDGPRSGR